MDAAKIVDQEKKLVEQEEKLFAEWRKCTKNFVIDGIIDVKTFLQQPCHFVFVLKETNQMGKTPLTSFLRDGAPGNGGHTWNPVCKWLSGEDKIFSQEDRRQILARIAVMNLKKEDGGSVTNMQKLNDVVKKDKDFIKRQLEIYSELSPVVFVCCGPGLLSMLNTHVLGNIDLHPNTSMPYAKPDNREVYYVAFNHPNCRKLSKDMIKRFKEITSLISLNS